MSRSALEQRERLRKRHWSASCTTTATAPSSWSLGGLVPELLCVTSDLRHAGTTDVDVQVDLEIASGAVNAARLEHALRNAEFEPDRANAWRWVADGLSERVIVKFELLADLDTAPADATVAFDACEDLAAVNLRGTGFATRDAEVQQLEATIGGVRYMVDVNVAGLARYLLAKTAAAHSRRLPKDWYDLAFVLLHNDAGGPRDAARAVRRRFRADLKGPIRTALDDLEANFRNPDAQGPHAYSDQVRVDHPDLDAAALRADAVTAVGSFHADIVGGA